MLYINVEAVDFGFRRSPKFDCAPNRATRKYLIRTLTAMSLYVIATAISVRVSKHDPSLSWKYAWALLPKVPGSFVPIAVVCLCVK